MEDVLDFLSHAGDKGLMPAATSTALAVATRNVFGVLGEDEQKNIKALDLDTIIRRFDTKRKKDFNPTSLKEYGRRVRRVIELYEQWQDNPANFSVKTRVARKPRKVSQVEAPKPVFNHSTTDVPPTPPRTGTFQSSCPVGPGRVVTLSNIPEDLTSAEADKLARFVRVLAIDFGQTSDTNAT